MSVIKNHNNINGLLMRLLMLNMLVNTTISAYIGILITFQEAEYGTCHMIGFLEQLQVISFDINVREKEVIFKRKTNK